MGKCQETGDSKDKSEANSTKDGQAGDGSQDIHYSIIEAEDRPGDEYSGEDGFTDPAIEGLKVDGQGFYSKDGYRAGFGVNIEGW